MHFSGCRRRAALPRPLGRRTTENKGKVIGDANHGACQVSPFRQVCFIARCSLPDPQIGRLRHQRHRSPRHLPRRPSARGCATTKRSWKSYRYLTPPFRTILPTPSSLPSPPIHGTTPFSLSHLLNPTTLPFRPVSRTGSSHTPLDCLHD